MFRKCCRAPWRGEVASCMTHKCCLTWRWGEISGFICMTSPHLNHLLNVTCILKSPIHADLFWAQSRTEALGKCGGHNVRLSLWFFSHLRPRTSFCFYSEKKKACRQFLEMWIKWHTGNIRGSLTALLNSWTSQRPCWSKMHIVLHSRPAKVSEWFLVSTVRGLLWPEKIRKWNPEKGHSSIWVFRGEFWLDPVQGVDHEPCSLTQSVGSHRLQLNTLP